MTATKPAVVTSTRLRSLDGLRGVAALSVVISHALIAFPQLHSASSTNNAVTPAGSFEWWLVHSPLHLTWLAQESVFVFFILSGIVLVLPVIRADKYDWKRYYPQRALRLYLPVWAALVWAVLVTVIVVLANPATGAAWVAEKSALLTPVRIVRDALLVTGTSNLDKPLWSLQWEMIFSLLLPLYALFALRARRFLVVKVVVIFACVFLGSSLLKPYIGDALFYLPMFALGALIAVELPRLRELAARIDTRADGNRVWSLIAVAAAALIGVYWVALIFSPPLSVVFALRTVSLAGAALVVFVAAFSPLAKAFLETRVVQWLGEVSFSVYLIHGVLLEAINTFLPDGARILVFLVGVPLSFLLAEVFRRVVERPSHRFAKYVGAKVSTR